MNLSLVLATCRRTEILSRTLSSFVELQMGDLDWELVLVDNADDPETQNLARQFEGRLPLTCLVEPRKGKNYALNTALANVNGELIVFTDDDVLADSHWLREMWEGSKRWPNHAVFGGRILPQFPVQTVSFDLENRLVRSAFVIADWKIQEGEYKPSMVWGPNFAVRASVLQPGFKFNTDFGPNSAQYLMGDETEFVYRLEQEGHVPVYLPEALVHHQIRHEQLEMDWLCERVAAYGGTFAFMSGLPNATLIWGVPRYMYSKMFEAWLAHLWTAVSGSAKTHFEAKLIYWYRRGMFTQYWRGVPEQKIIEY